MLIGLGKQIKKQPEVGFYTVTFTIPNADSGTAPIISDTAGGGTFTIPSQGNLVKTEVEYISPPGGGTLQPNYYNISLYGWTDGNGLYFPGDTYTMPNSNVTFTDIWQTTYAPNITSISPTSGTEGDVITFYGEGLGSAVQVKFNRNKLATPTIKSDTEITAVVPSGAASGNIIITLAGGGLGSISEFTRT